MNPIITDIKHRFQNAGIVEKLIYANIGVFLVVMLSNTFGFFFKSQQNILVNWLAMPADIDVFIYKPWTLITYGFLHTGFIHLLFNLIILFFVGNMFKDYFTSKQVINFYILGTIFGGILFFISYNLLPVFTNSKDHILLGASAGIYAILVGMATYLPNYQFKIPLLGYIKLWHIAAVWIILDLIQIPAGNAGGHIAHLGGALFGFFYVNYASNTKINIFGFAEKWFQKKEKSPLKTVHNTGKARKKQPIFKTTNQQEVDKILDKISKSGYDTLTKEEKEFLFKQGKSQ